jgi:hypothetical protein
LNQELLAFSTADREERIDQPRLGTPEYMAMRECDRQRRLRAAAILSTLETPEAADLYHAAQLFQHGDEPQDAWRAYELAREATERGEGRARWLTAAAYDRWLMYQSKPQKYGTQYVHDGVRHRLWDIDLGLAGIIALFAPQEVLAALLVPAIPLLVFGSCREGAHIEWVSAYQG